MKILCGLAVLAIATGAYAAPDINGGQSWGGWTLAGNSQNYGASLDDQLDGIVPTIWTSGDTSTDMNNSCMVYTTCFVWDGSELFDYGSYSPTSTEVRGTNRADSTYFASNGNLHGVGAGMTGGVDDPAKQGWQPGDIIIGIGWECVDPTASSSAADFTSTDIGAQRTLQAASYRGATDGKGYSYLDANGDSIPYPTNDDGDISYNTSCWQVKGDPHSNEGQTAMSMIGAGYGDSTGVEGGNAPKGVIKRFGIAPAGTGSGGCVGLISSQFFVSLGCTEGNRGDATTRDYGFEGYGTQGYAMMKVGLAPNGVSHNVTVQVDIIPEPATLSLLGLGGLGVLLRKRRR